ncbi:hypothetical protein [Muricoccus radiodurans]|uniref:hypothetical protein n=1 Tax=Muricoccus radiodurans TaxID=2231721 RepID=UPI003CE7D483
MGGGRLGAFFSEWGIVLVGILVIAGLLQFMAARGRRRRGGEQSDPLMPDMAGIDDTEEVAPARPGIYPNFAAVLEGFVLPLAAARPGWDRLDGAYDVPGRALARFDRNGTVYAINGETRFEPLLLAHAWMAEHPGEDALMVQPSKGEAGRLMLRPEVGWTDARSVRIETD